MPPHASATVRVRYSETDQMGMAYHAHYLVWCEIGRTELIRGLGTPYAELERQGVRLAVVEAAVRYREAAYYDDLLRIDTHVEHVRSRSVGFAYEIHRVDAGSAALLATASTWLLALDGNGRPRTLPPATRRALAAHAS
ncbi:MAG: acyl-CoA thioesterase [Longimicrobiales bacterium]